MHMLNVVGQSWNKTEQNKIKNLLKQTLSKQRKHFGNVSFVSTKNEEQQLNTHRCFTNQRNNFQTKISKTNKNNNKNIFSG